MLSSHISTLASELIGWTRISATTVAATLLILGITSGASAEDSTSPNISLDTKGLRISSADGEFSMRIGGRLHADGTWAIDDPMPPFEITDGTELRRARIDLHGSIYRDWKYFAEVDFADNGTSVKDFWVAYTGIDGWTITAGHQKQPYSLAIEMSSNDLPFIERGIDYDVITPFVDRAIGIRFDHNTDNLFFAAGFYGDAVGPNTSGVSNQTNDEGWGTAGKLVYAPIIREDKVIHLGFRSAFRSPRDNNQSVRMRDETSHMSNLSLIDTGNIAGVNDALLFGPEAAIAVGPFSLVGEYNRIRINRRNSGDLHFQGGHVAASYSLTGESRAKAYTIRSGEFKRLKPAENFSLSGPGCGAVELSARYAYQDLSDGDISGGREQVVSVGLNWYPNTNIRFLANWNRILDTKSTGAAPVPDGEGIDSFAARVQIVF